MSWFRFRSLNCVLLPVILLSVFTTCNSSRAWAQEDVQLTPREEEEFIEELRRWESQRAGLFGELAAAVEAGDPIETYYVLKRLHGGGVGPDGSEFELRRAEIRSRRTRLADMETRRGLMVRMESSKNLAGMDPNVFDEHLRAIEARIAEENEEIQQLEEEALGYAEKSIVAELPLVFDLLSRGGQATAEDPFAPPNSN